jgi:hypothetical protein
VAVRSEWRGGSRAEVGREGKSGETGVGMLMFEMGTLRSFTDGGEVLFRIGESFRGVPLVGGKSDDSGVGETGDGMLGIDTGLRFRWLGVGKVSLRTVGLS